MNYEKIYNEIVERGKARKLKGYKEKHHIIPKCLGGTNDNNNLVELTAKEHFICHKLLTEIYPNENGLHYAVRMLANMKTTRGREYIIGAREYQRLKENIVVSKKTRNKISKIHKGKLVSDSTRILIGNSSKGRIPTDETRIKMSKSRMNYIQSEETKQKISKSNTGQKRTKETRENISKSQLGVKFKTIICPHCKKKGGINIMYRYHFDNCKNLYL